MHIGYNLRGSIFEAQSREERMMFLFRFISLAVTSFFFLVGDSQASISIRVLMVGGISVSSFILYYLVIKNRGSVFIIKILVLAETVGISLILIPTGGLNSPYIWYALNTILITTVELDKEYCWVNLMIYFVTTIFLPYKMAIYNEDDLLIFITNESNLVLGFILMTAMIQLLSGYIKAIEHNSAKLTEANRQLTLANQNVKETMNHVMGLYQAVHLFTAQKDKHELMDLIIHYTKEITKSELVIFHHASQFDIDMKSINIEGDKLSESLEGELKRIILDMYYGAKNIQAPIVKHIGGKTWVLSIVKSTYKIYGLLGIEAKQGETEADFNGSIEQMQFLSELSSIVFERFDLDEVKDRLLITEEQNRIANEIHDSVLQKLFSISCGLFTIIKNRERFDENQISTELNNIRHSIDNAMKELRDTIYGLSWTKNGNDSFKQDIINYTMEVKRFNNVDIMLNLSGNYEILSPYQKKAVYRIICEGVGNAVHHGKAQNIKVLFETKSENSSLLISDDGNGFNLNEKTGSSLNGLGLKNMYSLANSLKGEVKMDSVIGSGTTIRVTIPNNNQKKREGEVV